MKNPGSGSAAFPGRATFLNRIAACIALSMAALFIAGCDKKPPAATAGVTVTESEAANASYPSENTASGYVRLTDGHYEDEDLVSSEIESFDAIGDLDGDGSEDRVVLLVTSTGGSGIFRELYVLRRVQGQLQISAPALLGDRVDVNELRVENGEIAVELVVQGADDPLCCPTQKVSYRFRLTGNALVETSGQQRIYLKQ